MSASCFVPAAASLFIQGHNERLSQDSSTATPTVSEMLTPEVQKHTCPHKLIEALDDVCVVRSDNEAGQGDHRHVAGKESAYQFETPNKLIAAFQRDIARWNRDNRHP
jgi:hypothetical protein